MDSLVVKLVYPTDCFDYLTPQKFVGNRLHYFMILNLTPCVRFVGDLKTIFELTTDNK
jgi:hypothetical protein